MLTIVFETATRLPRFIKLVCNGEETIIDTEEGKKQKPMVSMGMAKDVSQVSREAFAEIVDKTINGGPSQPDPPVGLLFPFMQQANDLAKTMKRLHRRLVGFVLGPLVLEPFCKGADSGYKFLDHFYHY